MRLRPLTLSAALLASGALCVTPGRASAGGATYVVAPDGLGAAACEPGTRPRTVFGGSPVVVGCRRDEQDVLLAASPAGFAGRGGGCVWVAPAGTRNFQDCFRLGSRRNTSSLSDYRIRAVYLRAARGLDGSYVVGLASSRVDRGYLRFHDDARVRETPAEVIEVDRSLASRLGAPARFSYMLGVIPPAADTCRGVTLEGRDGAGDLVGVDRLRRGSPVSVGVDLPGGDRCELRPGAGVRGEVAGALAFSASS